MFYISSTVQDINSYGVTDTEDGVEEFLTNYEIFDAVALGVPIEGVSGTDLRVVSPYDNMNVAKTILLRGFEYHLNKSGGLKYLHIYDNFDNEPIVLGEFCTSVSRAAFMDCVNRDGIQLVFDDRISCVDGLAFINLRDTFVRCDLTAICNDILRTQVYRAAMKQGYLSKMLIKNSIRDISEVVWDSYFKEACILHSFSYWDFYLDLEQDKWFLRRNKNAMLSKLSKVEKKPYIMSKREHSKIYDCKSASAFFAVNEACTFSFWKNIGLNAHRNYIYAGGKDRDIMEGTFNALKFALEDAEVI